MNPAPRGLQVGTIGIVTKFRSTARERHLSERLVTALRRRLYVSLSEDQSETSRGLAYPGVVCVDLPWVEQSGLAGHLLDPRWPFGG